MYTVTSLFPSGVAAVRGRRDRESNSRECGIMSRLRVLFAVCVAVGSAAAAAAQPPAPPKPGPELDKIKAMEGTWDAVVKTGENESKATATYKMEVGGLWLVSDFQGTLGDLKFQGKGMDSYDSGKKKYVSVWVDSMSTTPMIFEGNFDKDGKVLTMTGEGPGMEGKPVKLRSTSEMKDKDTFVFKMYAPDKDGKDQEMMTITYKRKK
jgi:hypothetical protein